MGNCIHCIPKAVGQYVLGSKFKDTRQVAPNALINPNISIDNISHPNYSYTRNSISTTRYTVWNFIPKNLYEQFHRLANLYFIFVMGINWIPEVKAYAKEVTMVPVLFVLTVTALKDAYEDYRRYKSDKKFNSRKCEVFDV